MIPKDTPGYKSQLSSEGPKIGNDTQALKTSVYAKEQLKVKANEQGNKSGRSVTSTNSSSNDIGSTHQKIWNPKSSLKAFSKAVGLTALVKTIGRVFETSPKANVPKEIPSHDNEVPLNNYKNEAFSNNSNFYSGSHNSEESESSNLPHQTEEGKIGVVDVIPHENKETIKVYIKESEQINSRSEIKNVEENHPILNQPSTNINLSLTEQKQKLEHSLISRDRALAFLKNTPHLSLENKKKVEEGLDKVNREILTLSKPIVEAILNSKNREECLQVFDSELLKKLTLESLKSTTPRETLLFFAAADQANCGISLKDLKHARPKDFDDHKMEMNLEITKCSSIDELIIYIKLGLISANTRLKNGKTFLEGFSFDNSINKEVRQALKNSDPEAYLQAKVSIYMLAAGHTLSLKGNSMEGFSEMFFIHKMNKLNQKLSDSGEIDETRMKLLEDVLGSRKTGNNLTDEEILGKLALNEPVLISTGHSTHSISVIIWEDKILGNKLAICNRGGGSNSLPIELYTFEAPITKEVLHEIKSAQYRDLNNFTDFFNVRLKNELAMTSSESDKELEKFAQSQVPMQVSGNCSYANLRAGMFALSMLGAQVENPNLAQDQSKLNILAQEHRYLEKFYTENFVEKFNNKVTHLKTEHDRGEDIIRIQQASTAFFTEYKREQAQSLYDIALKLSIEQPTIFSEIRSKFKDLTGYNAFIIMIKIKNGAIVSPEEEKAYNLLRELLKAQLPA